LAGGGCCLSREKLKEYRLAVLANFARVSDPVRAFGFVLTRARIAAAFCRSLETHQCAAIGSWAASPVAVTIPGVVWFTPRVTKMLVRLTKKLAEIVNGLDLSHCAEGDVLHMPDRHAAMLMAEGWAVAVESDVMPSSAPIWRPDARAVAAEAPVRRSMRESDDDDLISRLRLGVKRDRID
jgi:hypothetical protein